MLYAVVARPDVYLGKVVSVDSSAAMKVPGVLKVVQIEPSAPPANFNPLGGVAVVAKSTWAALKGREALKIVWDDGPNASYESKAYRATMETAARSPGKVARKEGDFDAAYAKAAKKVQAEYYLPHLAHATMEPPAAAARIVGGKCEVWSSVQSPQAARDLVAKRLGLDPSNVTVNVTLLGGGFGRKSKPDFCVEAAVVSKAMDGQPVKVVWTREDDLRHDYLHTVSSSASKAAWTKTASAWHGCIARSHRRSCQRLSRREEPIQHRTGHDTAAGSVAHTERPHREPGSGGAYAHRLVPLGVERAARICDAVIHRRDGRCSRQGPP